MRQRRREKIENILIRDSAHSVKAPFWYLAQQCRHAKRDGIAA
jgi:hypothetical protein